MYLTFFPAVLFFLACFLFAFYRPKTALFLPLVFSCAYLVRGQIFGLPTTLLEIILLGVLLGVWTANFRRIRVRPCIQGRTLIGVAIGSFVVATIISFFVSPHLHTSLGVLKAMIIEPIIYAITLGLLIDKNERSKKIVNALIAGGLVSSVLSLIFLRFGADFGRLRGIYDVPNSLALIVAPLCSIGLVGLISHGYAGAPPFTLQSYGVASLFFGGVLIATQSLAGILAVVVSVFTVMMCLRKSKKIILALGLILIFAIGWQIQTGKIQHLLNKQTSSLIAREQIWYTAVKMVEKNLIFGTGLGTFEPAYQIELHKVLGGGKRPSSFACTLPAPRSFSKVGYPVPCTLEWVVRDPHNFILSFWLNTGILGLVAILVLLAMAMKRLVTAITKTQDQYQILIGVALLTLIIFGLFDVPYWKNDLALIWWTLLL